MTRTVGVGDKVTCRIYADRYETGPVTRKFEAFHGGPVVYEINGYLVMESSIYKIHLESRPAKEE